MTAVHADPPDSWVSAQSAGRGAEPRGRHRATGYLAPFGLIALIVTGVARCLLGVAMALLLWTLLPTVGGWQSSLVLSGSMAPSFLPGDVAVVRPVAAPELHIGRVLLVDDPDQQGKLRLHRLADVVDGRLLLRGDANADADSTPVDASSVHGAVVLRIPGIGRPAVWAAEGDVAAVVATVVLGLVLLAAACWYRPDERPDKTDVEDLLARLGYGPVPRPASPRISVVKAALLAVLPLLPVLPTAGTASAAPYANTVGTPGSSLASNAYYTCVNAAYDGSVAAPGPGRAVRYYGLQETGGSTATNNGTDASANGTYVTTLPVFTTSGPPGCGASGTRAVTFNGTSQWVNTTATATAPATVSVAIWFRTTTTSGGRLIGFGNEVRTNASRASVQDDRHLYMTNSGQVAFGVLAGATKNAVISPSTYNDGAWHHAVGTLSSSGMVLYVDGVQVGSSTATTSATAASYTGAWRVAYDVLTGWPSAPTSAYFGGTLAHAAVYAAALSPAQVTNHHRAGI